MAFRCLFVVCVFFSGFTWMLAGSGEISAATQVGSRLHASSVASMRIRRRTKRKPGRFRAARLYGCVPAAPRLSKATLFIYFLLLSTSFVASQAPKTPCLVLLQVPEARSGLLFGRLALALRLRPHVLLLVARSQTRDPSKWRNVS